MLTLQSIMKDAYLKYLRRFNDDDDFLSQNHLIDLWSTLFKQIFH